MNKLTKSDNIDKKSDVKHVSALTGLITVHMVYFQSVLVEDFMSLVFYAAWWHLVILCFAVCKLI
jgi:hypothetical protein